MQNCHVCHTRKVMSGAGKTSKDAQKLDLCFTCYRKPGVASERRRELGLDGRKRATSSTPRPRKRPAAAARRDQNVPQGYESFEDLVRAITRDELRRLLEAVIE